MSTRRAIFLTGATGLLGRYFLRDLLASGQPVAVLIRDGATATAPERLAELLAFCRESLGRELPPPVLLNGDLREPHLGLGPAERRWLARRARAVLHAAAYVAYHPTPDGEPWETNVHGTHRLLELCRSIGVSEFHHLSTAFVCGDRRGLVREDELDCGGGSGNAYEQSKFAGEQLVRQFAGLCATIYRPSVVVGDSRTGYTSTYHHFYRFLELAVRLSSRTVSEGKSDRQRLPLRLPLTGEETQNLVPVDWVSQALLALMQQPHCHGQTFHLVARQPVRLDEIKAIIEDLLQLEGIRWAGRTGPTNPTPLEQLILEQFEDYWSYLHSNLAFDCRNTQRALPDLPPPRFGRELVIRLLQFAQADRWGRERGRSQPSRTSDCAHYLEFVLPEQARRSPLARALPDDLLFVLDIQGPGGGRWSCRCEDGSLSVRRRAECAADVTYRMDAVTFGRLIHGRQSPQKAFFDGLIEIDGDMEKALKVAMLIEQFLAESPNRPAQPMEALHAAVGS